MQNQSFWRGLVNAAPQNKVARATAIFVIPRLLMQIIGYKAHRMQITFPEDPVLVEDLFSTLKRLSDGAAGCLLKID